MRIELNKIVGNFNGKDCFVLVRCGTLGGENLIMTAQKLDVDGMDFFSPIYISESADNGKNWSQFHRENAFVDNFSKNGMRSVFGDVTHIFHKKTAVPLIVGRRFLYAEGKKSPQAITTHRVCYSTYNVQEKKFNNVAEVEVEGDYPFGITSWGSQMIEEENGDILIPVAILYENGHYTSAVMRCAFDGETLKYVSMSNQLDVSESRGVFEASLIKFSGKYYLTVRHDSAGYFSISDDGQNFSEPEPWHWDNGEILPTYNTQQHWLENNGNLYLIYTRRAENNDHVFRNRAPLFVAEVDTENMRILRSTERIVVPERGARLGNFGVTPLLNGDSLVTAAEWMQPIGCEKYGSDNSVFFARVTN